jgi:predicted deacetylase
VQLKRHCCHPRLLTGTKIRAPYINVYTTWRRRMLTKCQKRHKEKLKCGEYSTCNTQKKKKVKTLILKPQTYNSEIKEGINSLHVTSLSPTEVPGWCPHTLDSRRAVRISCHP